MDSTCRYGCCGKECAKCGELLDFDILDGLYFHSETGDGKCADGEWGYPKDDDED